MHAAAVPCGGFEQSGIGRECGTFRLGALLEPKRVLPEVKRRKRSGRSPRIFRQARCRRVRNPLT
ncbi:hypothetical protein F3J19_19920 [Burkholderia sp. Ax-1724]|nr:hypothetical protein [Burkholderia sp. Ax-1724]